jgi:hypothetical protein
MFEVYYRPPPDPRKEAALNARISSLGGRLTYREVPDEEANSGVCLTYEFNDHDRAESAAQALRKEGEHVEGPVDYGP